MFTKDMNKLLELEKENHSNKNPFSFDEILSIDDFTLQKPQFLKSDDEINLAYYEFLPEYEPKAIVIFYHGGGMYINKTYQYIGHELKNKFNIGVYMIDVRGHGYSEGLRGDAPNVESVFKDIDKVINFVHQKHPNQKIYLAGHSSGAGLLINYNSWKTKNNNLDKNVSGYIFIAPFLGENSGTIKINNQNSFVKKVRSWVYFFNFLSKGLFLGNTRAVFFNYPKEILKSDPLILKYYTCNMSLATSPYDPKKLFGNFTIPIAIYIGSDDEQFLPKKIIEYKKYATQVSKTSIAKIVPNLKHLSILIESASLINGGVINLN